MKKAGCFLILFFAFFANRVISQDRGLGLGIIAGEPTGISLKNWQSRSTAIDGALAWSFVGNDYFQFHGNYLSHNFSLLEVEKGQLPFYYGIGGRIKFVNGDDKDDKTRLGVRIPLGLAYLFEKVTLDIFVEAVPVLDLVPETNFDLNAALGIRYFFSK